jgi:hypothetical protein
MLACSALPAPELANFLDEDTGISLTVVDQPWILARDRRDVAANARDYLTLVAAERDEMGRRQLVLLVHRWSTIDRRVGGNNDDADQSLVLVADGRDFKLTTLAERLPREFSRNDRLLRPPVSQVATSAYKIDPQTLRYLASSKQVSAFYVDTRATLSYALWQDGRAALQRFLDVTGAPR